MPEMSGRGAIFSIIGSKTADPSATGSLDRLQDRLGDDPVPETARVEPVVEPEPVPLPGGVERPLVSRPPDRGMTTSTTSVRDTRRKERIGRSKGR